jgi:hypothetical protein
MPMAPTEYVHLGHLDAIVKEASALLGPEVLHLTYRLRPDSTDEPSIFFRILVADSAEVLLEAVRPLEDWGFPYFNYRSKSEQDRRKDPDWE